MFGLPLRPLRLCVEICLSRSVRVCHFVGIALVLIGIWVTTGARRVPRATPADL
jgi:hypothetical protein